MELTERRMFDEYTRDCAGVNVREVLRRQPMSLSESVAFWARVVNWLPRLFAMKREGEQLVREGRRTRAEIDETVRWQMRHVFPSGYSLGTEEAELARARCALSKARWRLQVAQTPASGSVNPFPPQGLGQAPLAPAPDSTVANSYLQANAARSCVPGQAGSAVCAGLATPRPITRVVIHTATSSSSPVPGNACGNPVPLARIITSTQNNAVASGAHYYVDRDGTITQMVREANVAFHVIGHSQNSIGIEHADVCNRPDPYTTELYERSAALVRDIARRNGFALSVFGIDTNNAAAATVVGHSTIGHHGDPGPYWDWEYYAALLRWDGITAATRPIRLVTMVSQAVTPPTDWQVKTRVQVLGENRVCIPNSHCANRNHSYGDNYWKATANTAGTSVQFPFDLTQSGLYKISLWWPNVASANPATDVEAEIQKAGGTARANGSFDQRGNYGRWNDLGQPFTFTVPQTGAQGTLLIKRASVSAGNILADAVRILRVG